jgi:hypothetical protein
VGCWDDQGKAASSAWSKVIKVSSDAASNKDVVLCSLSALFHMNLDAVGQRGITNVYEDNGTVRVYHIAEMHESSLSMPTDAVTGSQAAMERLNRWRSYSQRKMY